MVCSVSKCKLSKRLNMITGSLKWDSFILSLTEKNQRKYSEFKKKNTNLTPFNL